MNRSPNNLFRADGYLLAESGSPPLADQLTTPFSGTGAVMLRHRIIIVGEKQSGDSQGSNLSQFPIASPADPDYPNMAPLAELREKVMALFLLIYFIHG